MLHAQAIVWAGVSALSVLIVASRKHYTVDVVIAWYVVPLVFHALARRWSTKRHATDGALLGDVVYAADVESGTQLKVALSWLCCLAALHTMRADRLCRCCDVTSNGA